MGLWSGCHVYFVPLRYYLESESVNQAQRLAILRLISREIGSGFFELHCGNVLRTNFYSHSCASLQKSRGNVTVYRH